MKRIDHAVERLDEPVHDEAVLLESLGHVAQVNRWLGSRRALLRHLPGFAPPHGPVRILDVATGSADLPRSVAEWAREHERSVRITATDLHPQILAVARKATRDYPEIQVQAADALALPFPDGAFDVALLSMALHHFEGEDQVLALRELGRVARRGVLVGDLERNWPNYLGARLLAATLWRGNPLTRHDGPLSVRRAFTADELMSLAWAAGLKRPRVHRHFFYRLVLLADGGGK